MAKSTERLQLQPFRGFYVDMTRSLWGPCIFPRKRNKKFQDFAPTYHREHTKFYMKEIVFHLGFVRIPFGYVPWSKVTGSLDNPH